MGLIHWRAAFGALAGSYVRRERGRTLLTVLGVALGVTVLVAINMAIESSVAGFKRTLDDVAGRATLTVRGNGTGLPGRLLPAVAAQPGVQSAAPLIQGDVVLPASDGRTTETLLFLGVDLLRSEERDGVGVRDVRFRLEPGREAASFFSDPSSLIFTERLARRIGKRLGDRVRLIVGGIPRTFTIGALIDAGTLGNTLDGAVVVTDIGMADLLLNRRGLIDRIDLVTKENQDLGKVQAELQAALPTSVLVERPGTRGEQVDRMLAAFRFNLGALGHVSLLVGAFLIFNTMSVAVVRRAAVIGTLRAMGVSRTVVRGVFLVEGALMGLAGGVVGIVAGILLAKGLLLRVVATAISINFVPVQARSLNPSPGILMAALALGVATAVAAAWGPARQAAATAPANTMRRGAFEGRRRPMASRVALGIAAAAAGAGLLKLETLPVMGTGAAGGLAGLPQGLPWIGYAASLLIVIGFVCWSRPLLALTATLLRWPLIRVFGAEGILAIAGTRGALGRAGVAISGLMIALGMTISIGVMVASFRDTVVVWMGQVLRADLYLVPETQAGSALPAPMPAEIAERVAKIPGVATIDPFRWHEVVIGGRPTHLGAGRFDVVRYDQSLRILDGRPALQVLREARRMNGVIVSEAFARKQGVKAGDRIAVPTPKGNVSFPIAGVYYDYSTEQGYVIMDRELYLRYYDDPLIDSLAIYLRPGANRAAVKEAVRAAAAHTASMPGTILRANDELRAFALDAFNRTFWITRVMELIAIVIAVLGVANTLLSQIIDRRDEIATLRTIGASRWRVARIIMLESSLVGLVGVGLGVAAGLILSWILAKVIMLQSFGWTIQYAIPWATVAQVAGVVFFSTLVAGALPAREATRTAAMRGPTVGG